MRPGPAAGAGGAPTSVLPPPDLQPAAESTIEPPSASRANRVTRKILYAEIDLRLRVS